MINEATVAQAKYYPERLVDARVVSVTAGFEASPPILSFRRFTPKFLRLVDISVERNANVTIRTRADDLKRETNAGALLDQEPINWNLIGIELLEYNLYAATNISNYRTHFGLWVYEPTVAHKLKHKRPLSEEEAKIAKDLNIQESVDKGILPLPISYMVEREYDVLDEVPTTLVTDLDPGETESIIVAARRDEFLVLTAIASQPGTVAQNIRIAVDRDADANYLEMPAYPLSLDRDVRCFIPALREIKVKATASASVTGYTMRFTVRRVRMTNLLRVRFGLMSQAEAPGDVWQKVKGGVL